ncbi:MAG: hypothetical protein EAZ44_05960 [Cytophagia bacterium]|nr:MAG: hypothetical protein EAZ44_05960 [Cytophagia bacterium]TAG42861.1 MAG: hypothetical protein EAZ31_05435 [Cytophagia bacterium]TAH29600.1 MAG: hypothetical protein EAZ06_06130 [Cytophagales bacterium]
MKNIYLLFVSLFFCYNPLLAQNNCIDIKVQKIITSLKKGCRPEPNLYWSKECNDKHLKQFKEGASYLVAQSILDRFGRTLLGRPDGQFVMSKKEMDLLLNNAKGNLAYVETQLGIPAGAWKNNILVRIDIPLPFELNIRIPSGNESGANELWIAGGKLPTGYLEAVIDAIPEGKYTEKIIDLK